MLWIAKREAYNIGVYSTFPSIYKYIYICQMANVEYRINVEDETKLTWHTVSQCDQDLVQFYSIL